MSSYFDFFEENRPHIPNDHGQWPKNWQTSDFRNINTKDYSGFEEIKLPQIELPKILLEEAIQKRLSRRDFDRCNLNLDQVSAILKYSLGTKPRDKSTKLEKRFYPSGGAFYPIEAYLYAQYVNNIEKSLYHYSPRKHSLKKFPRTDFNIINLNSYDWLINSSLIIFLSFKENISSSKYGPLAYKLAILEAGHISENIYLCGAALDIRVCAIGSFNFKYLMRILKIDVDSEYIFYAIALG